MFIFSMKFTMARPTNRNNQKRYCIIRMMIMFSLFWTIKTFQSFWMRQFISLNSTDSCIAGFKLFWMVYIESFDTIAITYLTLFSLTPFFVSFAKCRFTFFALSVFFVNFTNYLFSLVSFYIFLMKNSFAFFTRVSVFSKLQNRLDLLAFRAGFDHIGIIT